MSLNLKVYIGAVTLSAIALFIFLIPSLPSLSNIWPALIFFLAISAFAEFLPVGLPSGGSISIAFLIDFIIILVYGPALAILITALSVLIAEVMEKKKSWYKIIFNTAEYALSSGIAGLVYLHTGGIIGFQNFFKFAFPAFLCALAYYLVNSILVAIVISFAQDSKVTTVWRENIKEMIPSYLVEALMGFLMAIAYVEVGMIGILLFLLPLLLARRSFELYAKMRELYENLVHNNKNYLEEVKNMRIKIFLSYSHNNINIADKVDKFFHSINILLTRDVRDAVPYSSIKIFMDTIRDHDYVIILISDAYLTSINCMYEVIQFIKEKDYINRTFPIVIDNKAQIFNRSKHNEYICYWQEKYIEFEAKIKTLQTVGSVTLYNELDKIEKIQSNIGDFLDKITDLNCVTLEKLENTNYKAIIDKIIKFSNSISK